MRRTRRLHLPIACIALLVSAAVMHAATTIGANPLTATLSYTKGATTLPTAKVSIAPVGTTNSIYFTINPVSLPSWLQVDKTNGTCTIAAPITLTFSPSLLAANNPAGTYTALVEIDSAGLTSINVTVNMTVTNAAPTVTSTLSISPTTYTPGNPSLPTGTLTVKSSGDPVSFTVSATPSWVILGATSAVAYSWGTNISVTFAQSAFDSPTVNSTLTGSITVKTATATLAPNLISIAIGQPVATITSISPKQVPQIIAATAVRTIAVQGTGFANGMNVTLGGATGKPVPYNCATFSAVSASAPSTDAWCLQSSEQFFLRLSSGTLSGASATANQLILYLSAAANGQIPIQVVTTPIVYAVTDAASFIQPAPNQFLNVAPYEMLSIFGDNFGTPSAPIAFVNERLPNVLTDAISGNPLQVDFTDASGTERADSYAYLLLWTPTQINLLAPSTLPPSSTGKELAATVWAGGGSSTPSNATTFNVVQSSPGMLTFGGGQGVVVNADNSINSSTNPAKFGSAIVLYLSGMGDPEAGSAVPGVPGGTPAAGFAGCAKPAKFLLAEQTLNPSWGWVTFDGAILDSTVLAPSATAPCFDPSTVSVKFGNLTLTTAVTYAGFTENSIAGLYQVNVALPLSNDATLGGLTPPPSTAPPATPYPIQVSIGGGTSQPGVNVYVSK